MTGPGGTPPEDWGVPPPQLFWLLLALIGGTALLSLPGPLALYAGQDGWLAALLGLPLGIVPLLLWYALDVRLPGLTLTQMARAVLGPVAGSALAVLPVVLFASTLASTPREVADLVGGIALPRTPMPVVLALLLLPVVWMVRAGLETLARMGELLVPAGIAALLLILLPVTKDMRTINLLPLLARGWRPVLQGAAAPAAFYAETAYLFYVLPFRGRGRGPSLGAAVLAVTAVACMLSVSTAALTAIFGPLLPKLAVPVFQATRVVSIAQFIEHLDALLLVAWVALSFVKMAAFFYCFCLALGQLLGLRDYRPLTLPAAVYTATAALYWFDSTASVSHWIMDTWPFWGGALTLGPPLLVWVVALARGIGRARPGQAARGASGGGARRGRRQPLATTPDAGAGGPG